MTVRQRLYTGVIAASDVLRVEIEQRGQPVEITTEPSLDSPLSHPIGHTGRQIFCLGPFPKETSVEVFVEGCDADHLPRVSVLPADDNTDFLATLTKAGQSSATDGLSDYESLTQDGAPVDLVAYARLNAAQLHFMAFRLDEAWEHLSQVDITAIPFWLAYKVALKRAEVTFLSDEYQDSIPHFEQAHALITECPSADVEVDLAEVLYQWGFARWARGNEGARGDIHRALDIARRHNNTDLEGHVLNNLGGAYSKEPAQAIIYFQQAINLLRGSSVRRELVYTMGNLMQLHASVGEYRQAIELAHEALDYMSDDTDPSQIASIHGKLGSFYLALGDGERSEQYARMARDVNLQGGRERRGHFERFHLARALILQGRHDEAKEELIAATAEAREQNIATGEVMGLELLARVQILQQDFVAAAQTLSQYRDVTQKPGHVSAIVDASIQQHQGNTEAAQEILTSALERLAAGLPGPQLEVLTALLDVFLANINYDGVIAHHHKIFELVDSVLSQLETYRLGPAWSARTHQLTCRLAAAYFARSIIEQSHEDLLTGLAIHEQSRGVNLLRQRRLVNQEFSKDTQRLVRELQTLAKQRSVNQQDSEGWQQINSAYYKKLEEVHAQLPMEIDVDDSTVEVPTLLSDQQILDFVLVPGNTSYVISIDTGGLHLHELAYVTQGTQKISQKDEHVASLVDNTSLAQQLFEHLNPTTRELMVLAPGEFSELPLEGLCTQWTTTDYALESVQRLTTLTSVDTSSRDKDHSVDLAIISNPTFAIAPVSGPGEMRAWAETLKPLPWAEKEASDLESLYAQQSVATMTGDDATRSSLFSEEVRRAKIVHVATHGYFNPSTPDLVGIALSPENDNEGFSFVSVEDFLGLPFSAELVVISGCETGRGQARGGEGVMSMARAFLAQGVANVVATLWPVSDRASHRFMLHFYESFRQHGAPGKALIAAQEKMRHSRFRDPKYWASYFVISS